MAGAVGIGGRAKFYKIMTGKTASVNLSKPHNGRGGYSSERARLHPNYEDIAPRKPHPPEKYVCS